MYGNAAQGTPTGHILSYRYASGSETAVRAMVAPMADHVDITKWANGSGVVETYPLSADNTLRGEPTIAPSNITHIWHFGDGCDDYTAIASLVSEGMVLQTLMGYGIHRHLEPQFTGPGAGLALLTPRNRAAYEHFPGPWRLPAYGGQRRALRVRLGRREHGPTRSTMRRWIVDMLHIQTGIPPSVWGLSGVGTSGTALDRLMFAAMARVRTYRRHLETILAEIFDALGAPAGEYRCSVDR